MSNPKFYQCTSCGYEWKHGLHGGHDCVGTLNAHYEALREKCEELQAKLNTAIDALDEANEGIARRQGQLDEAAKQEPVGRFCKSDGGTLYPEGIWTEVNELYNSEDCVPLFRHPPNLPALIEQARAEERESCLPYMRHKKHCVMVDYQDTRLECTCGYAAIRARSGNQG